MKLYHGTNADIDAIDLNRGMLHKDFGKRVLSDICQCPTHFSQATGETRLFRRTLTCPLYREWRKGRFRELLKAALLLLKIVSIRKKCVKKEKKLRFFLYYSFLTAVYYE